MSRKQRWLQTNETRVGIIDPAGEHTDGVTLIDQVFHAVQRRIRNGELPPRSRVPSVRELAAQYRISNETAHRAYDKLVAHGYLEPRRGSGFYVLATQSPYSESPWLQRSLQSDTANDWRSLLHSDLPYERQPGNGALPEAWMDRRLVTSAFRRLTRLPPRAVSEYEAAKGYLPLREQLQLKLAAQGIAARPDQIVITAGAIEALHLILWSRHITHPEFVMIEDPSPPMHIQRAMADGLQVLRVPREANGPSTEAIRELCTKHRPRAFLCSSLLHNPTSMSLTPHRAHQLLTLAEEFDFVVIDDDTYGDLLPPTDLSATVRLATLDQLKRVFHIGSFSKTLGAGLRVGYIAAGLENIERIVLYKAASVISSCTLGQRVVHEILSQGKYRHHCDSLRSRLLEIREATAAQLVGIGCVFTATPSIGMYLWASLGEGVAASAVASAMAERKYLTAPARLFSGADSMSSYMRFNIPATFRSSCIPALNAILRSTRRPARRIPA